MKFKKVLFSVLGKEQGGMVEQKIAPIIEKINQIKSENLNAKTEKKRKKKLKDDDDLDIPEYYLDDRKNIKKGKYFVLESETDDFNAFDEIEVIEITSTGLKIIKEDEKEIRYYPYSDLSTVIVNRDEDYDLLFK